MNPIAQVFRKELREMFRDKRVRTSAFIMPALLIVGMLYLFGTVIQSLGKPQGQRIHVVRTDSPFVQALRQAKFNVIEVANLPEGERLIREGKARLLLHFENAPQANGQIRVTAAFDPKQQMGQIALAAVSRFLDEVNKKALATFLERNGLPTAAGEAVKVTRREIQVGSKGSANELIVGFLPYLIVVWAFYGGFSIVSDLVAGEKEKNTLETLLITPVRRTQIVLGKFLALSVVCFLSSVSSLLGVVLLAVINPPQTRELFKSGLGVTPGAVGIILLVLIPTVALFASVLIAVSSYAKNTREAQTHLTLVSFVVLMPAIFSQFIGLTDLGNARWIHFVPVLNTANTIRTALLGKTEALGVVATIGVSLVLALIALRWAVWLFNREQVLTRV